MVHSPLDGFGSRRDSDQRAASLFRSSGLGRSLGGLAMDERRRRSDRAAIA